MANDVHDAARLRELQALPLDRKILITQTRIIEWYTRNKGQVYVSYSGGKDSTVLLHIIRNMGFSAEQIPAVFSNTGLEYAEIQNFARQNGADFVHPKMRFDEVISTYGYPIISKEVADAIYYARRIRNGIDIQNYITPPSESVQNLRDAEREKAERTSRTTENTLRRKRQHTNKGKSVK